MKKILLIKFLLILSSIADAKTYEESPYCSLHPKKVTVEDGPFLFKSIEMSGPHVVIVNKSGASLRFNCLDGIYQFENKKGAVSSKTEIDSKVKKKVNTDQWLILQEDGKFGIFSFGTNVLMSHYSRKFGVNLTKIDPIEMTHQSENPVRTKIKLDPVLRTVVIQDPTDTSKSIAIKCDSFGGNQVSFHANKVTTLFKAKNPNPYPPLTMRGEKIKYSCNSELNFNYKSGLVQASAEERETVPMPQDPPLLPDQMKSIPAPKLPSAPPPLPGSEGGAGDGIPRGVR